MGDEPRKENPGCCRLKIGRIKPAIEKELPGVVQGHKEEQNAPQLIYSNVSPVSQCHIRSKTDYRSGLGLYVRWEALITKSARIVRASNTTHITVYPNHSSMAPVNRKLTMPLSQVAPFKL